MIFLYQFVIHGDSIEFVLNQAIGEDMIPDVEQRLQPLVQVCSETLLRYKRFCRGNIIMDGNILMDEDFEVMLSQGMGKHFPDVEKDNLFTDAHAIAELLIEVMDRRSKEAEQGIHSEPKPVEQKRLSKQAINRGLEALGDQKLETTESSYFDSEILSLSRLTPEDYPSGVKPRRSYDHRGHSMLFEHDKLGELGRIVLIDLDDGDLKLEVELSKDNPETFNKKQKLLEEIMSIVEADINTVQINVFRQ